MRQFKFKFNHMGKKWDARRCFHSEPFNNIKRGGFVTFETGELIVTGCPASYRKRYEDFDITLTTSVENTTQLFLDEKRTQPVKQAWLTQGGQQLMAIDHEQKVAVHLASNLVARHPLKLPQQYRGALAFWPKSEVKPTALSSFPVSKPLRRKVVSELRSKLVDARAIVSAVFRINPKLYWPYDPKVYVYEYARKYPVSPDWVDLTAKEIADAILSSEYKTNWSAIRFVGPNGFQLPRAVTFHDYLYI